MNDLALIRYLYSQNNLEADRWATWFASDDFDVDLNQQVFSIGYLVFALHISSLFSALLLMTADGLKCYNCTSDSPSSTCANNVNVKLIECKNMLICIKAVHSDVGRCKYDYRRTIMLICMVFHS